MVKNIFDELDIFFKEKGWTESDIAKFFLSPDETSYFEWQIARFRRMYENKEVKCAK